MLSTESTHQDLSTLHFPLPIAQKLLEIYADRVDSNTKILHFPTFRIKFLDALQHPHKIAPGLEAVMFAVYLSIISSLDDEECHVLLGEEKSILSARGKAATSQALINAGFLTTPSLETLQAYVLFLVSSCPHLYQCTMLILK